MSIHNIPEIIKQKAGIDHFTFVFILVLIGVGVSAFGLGRLSAQSSGSNESKGVIITNPNMADLPQDQFMPQEANALSSQIENKSAKGSTSGNYLASKNGKMYYTKNCKASSRIKEENKIWFDTAKEAESLGYKASASCK